MRELILTLFALLFVAAIALPVVLFVRQHLKLEDMRRRVEAAKERMRRERRY